MNLPDDLPDDEIVSAVLDGEADDATRAKVDDDPMLRARLADFAATRDELRAVAVPEGLLDHVRQAVVARMAGADPLGEHGAAERGATERTAGDAARDDHAEPAGLRPVARPTFARSAGRARRTTRAAWAGAAAAAVLLVVAIGSLGGRGGDDTGDASTAAFSSVGSGAADSSSERAGASTAGAATPPRNATGASASTGAGGGAKSTGTGATATALAPRDLGAVPDLDTLAAAYRSTAASAGAPTAVPPAVLSTVPGPGDAACGPVTAVALLGQRRVQLVAGPDQVTVFDSSTCTVIDTFSR